MHRLNLTIDEALYEQVRAYSFLEKKSISEIIRNSLKEHMEKRANIKKAELLLEAKDEREILDILKNDEEFKNKFNL